MLKKTNLLSMNGVCTQIFHRLTANENISGLSCFERFWRPAFGYAVSLTWMMHMLTVCYVVWSDNPRAPEIIMALVETTSLWSVALGVLGISVVKNTSKSGTRKTERNAAAKLK